MLGLPEGTIFLHTKEQIENFNVALNCAYEMLDKGIEKGIKDEEDGVSVRIKCVTEKCFRVEVSGQVFIPDTKEQKTE